MLPYIIILLLGFLGIAIYDLTNNRRFKTTYFILLGIIITLVIGLRYRVGGDTWAYMGDYVWRHPLSEWKFTFIDPYQPGYTFLCSLGKSFSEEFYVFQLIHASILNICLFYFIWKNTKYIFTALFAILISNYLYYSTEILREILAVMIFILNFKAFRDGKWLKYYLGIAFACLFHISAIFLIILPLLKGIKCNKSFLLIYAASGIFFLFTKNILSAFSSVAFLSSKIDTYIDQESHGLLADLIALFRVSIFPLLYCFVAKFYSHKNILFERMILIMSLFGLGSFFNPIIFSRATNYFMIFFIVSISQYAIECYRNHKAILHQYAIVMTICFLYIYSGQNLMYGKYKRWVPYVSIFNPVNINRDNYN